MFPIKRFARPLLWLAMVVLFSAEIASGGDLSPLPSPSAAVLMDFYADWCGPCRSMAPSVESLAQAGYLVERINIDRQPELARRYGVSAVPCYVVVEQGREIDRVTGVTTIERLKLKLGTRGERRGARQVNAAPHPAWRYERPTGYRAAVVRIFCCDARATGSASAAPIRAIGSGALVRWNGRIVVLTATHVVKEAKRIVVELCTGKRHEARVLKIDAVWDCAVLELSGRPEGVLPAEVELGDAAMQQNGNRLESCGYGPDGRLACNLGLFLGYKRSGERPQGPDDWMILSGHARQGDSGGPVFNERGRLVGVLWGSDGEAVAAVQAGRLHLLLEAAVPERQSGRGKAEGGISLVALRSPEGRTPTPAAQVDVTLAAQRPVLPWRQKEDQKISAEQREIDGLIALEKARAANPPPCCPTPAAPPSTGGTPVPAEPKEGPLSPVLTIAIVLAAFIVTGLAFGLTKKKS